MSLQIHPIALLLPRMTAAEFSELKSDIQSNGCHTPIELYEGQILDGRHRYLACCELGKDYVTNTYRGDDPVGFVRSLNIHRRNLTAAQRAMVEVSLSEWCESGSDGSSSSLLPCPFCGKQPEIRPNQKNLYKQTHVVIGCFNAQCLIAPSAVCYYKAHSQKTGLRWAIAKIAPDWNTRENAADQPRARET